MSSGTTRVRLSFFILMHLILHCPSSPMNVPGVDTPPSEIAACYGSDMTDHALNHRFRKVRAATNIISIARAQGYDMKDMSTDENLLPSTQQGIDKNSRISGLVVSSLRQHLLTSLPHRHCQILWAIHHRRNSVPVPHHQEGRRGSSSNCQQWR